MPKGLRAFALLNFLAIAAIAPLRANWTAPSDWTVQTADNGAIMSAHPQRKAFVIERNFPDLDTDHMPEALRQLARIAAVAKLCPSLAAAEPTTFSGGRAASLGSHEGQCDCYLYAFAAAQGIKSVLVIEPPGTPVGVDALVRSYVMRATAAGPASTPGPTIAQAAPNAALPGRRLGNPPATAARGPIGPNGLAGVWVGVVVRPYYDPVIGMTVGAQVDKLVLTRGGYFMDEMPSHAALNDGAAIALSQKEPTSAGRYTVLPGKIVLTFASGKTETVIARQRGGAWELSRDGNTFQPKHTFPTGSTLSGSYTTQSVAQTMGGSGMSGSGVFVFGQRDLSFSSDGRFARGGEVSTTAPSFVIQGAPRQQSGRYRIEDSGLILSYDDGHVEISSLWTDTSGPEIWIDDTMYKRAP